MIVELFHCITRIKPLNKVVYKVVFKMAVHEIEFLAHLEKAGLLFANSNAVSTL